MAEVLLAAIAVLLWLVQRRLRSIAWNLKVLIEDQRKERRT